MADFKKVDQIVVAEYGTCKLKFPLCDREDILVKEIDVFMKNTKAKDAVNGKLIDNYDFDVMVPSGGIWTSTSGSAWCRMLIDNKWLFTEKAGNVMICVLKCGVTDCKINEKCTFAKSGNSFIVVPKRLIDDIIIQDILE